METSIGLRERLRRSRDWVVAIDTLEQEADNLATEQERSDWLFHLAALSEEVIPERDRALAIYQRAWRIYPENMVALARARTVYRELGRLEMVAKLGAIELRSLGASEMGALTALVGEALLDCRQPEQALPVLQRALELDPESVKLKDAIAAAGYDQEFWRDSVERLASEATNADSNTAARMLLRAARIQHLEAPDDERYEELLRRVLENDAQSESGNFLFEALLATQQRWDELEMHHNRRAYAAPDEAERAQLYRRFALEWVQRFKDRGRGGTFFAKAIRAASDNGSVSMRSIVAAFLILRETHGEQADWNGFLELVDLCLDQLRDEQRLFVALQAGLVAWKQIGDLGRARHYFDIVREVEPESPDLADFASEVPNEAASDSDESSFAGEGDMANTDVDAGKKKGKKKRRKRRKKDVVEATPETPATPESPETEEQAAEPASESVDAAAPAEESVAEESVEAAAPAEETVAEESVEAAAPAEETVAEESVEAAPPAEESVAEEPVAEESVAEEPVAEEPVAEEEPRVEEISAELHAAMETAAAAEADGGNAGIDAWKSVVASAPDKLAPRKQLARVLGAAEKWNALIECLKETEKEAAQTAGEKVEVLREMAVLYRERLRNDVQAINALNQMIELQPHNLALYDELAAAYEAKKRWPDLVGTLNRKAEKIADHGERVALFLQIANLYIERFSNQAEAIKAFEKVLELDSDNVDAIGHLLAVYEKRRDWEKLIRLKESEIGRIDDPGERAEKTYEVAKLAATRVKKPDVCIVWWEKVLETDPAHEEAIGELFKLYERAKNWEGLAEICSKRATIASDEKTQVDSLQKLGLLYQDKLDDTEKAIGAWRRLLEIDPNHRRGQDSIKKLYVAASDWDALEEFYRAADKLSEYVRVLERQVDSDDEPDRLQLAMKVAVLYRDEIQKSDRAMRAFEKVLTFDESNLEAAEALIPLYEAGRDPRKLVSALTIQLDATEDPATRQERLRRLAEYSEEKLRDKGASFGWWLKAQAEDHDAEWIREPLERLATETGSFAELVEAYKGSYDKFSDAMASLPLMLVVAQLQEIELADIDGALETNRRIHELDDTDESALGALERLYLGKQEFGELLAVYERKLELTSDPDERTQIQSKIGQLYEDEVKDDDKAISAYDAILNADGDNLTALRALDRIYLRNERWAELGDALVRQIMLVSPDDAQAEHVELKFRLGAVHEEHLVDVAAAIDCYRDILDLDSAHEGARQALERHLANEDEQAAEQRLAAAGILEPIYEQIEEWEPLIGVHEIQLGASDDQMRNVALLMRIGELHSSQLGDAEKSFDAFARAFREDPATESAKQQLEELCSLLDDGWPRLVALFEVALATDVDALLAHELATKVANAYGERLDNTDKAVEYYRRALSIEPDDLNAIGCLEQIFTRDERYAELLEIYRKRVDISSDPDVRMEILFRIASIHEEMLEKPEDAISTFNEILGQDGDNLQALRALDRLYVSCEHWQELADNVGRQLVLCEDNTERVTLLVRLAQLRETQLGELAAAVETYQQVIELHADNPDAISALERLISMEDHELTIAQLLEPIYQARSEWDKQIGVYEIMAKHAFDPERKIELLHQIAELHELGGDDGAASFDTYARAFREEPGNETTHAQLDRLARMFGRWRDLVTLVGEVAEGVGDEELKVRLLTTLAQVHELELGDDAAAVATYTRILEVAPSHVDAASAIQAVHERNSDYPALVAVLKRKSELIMELPERKSLLYKAAQIQEEVLEDADAAIATFNEVLEMDDIDYAAMDALERLYIQLERWEPLKDVYAKKADLAEDPQDKKQMLFVLGQVYDRELGDVAKAIETYQAILDIDADELSAIQALDRLYGQAERWYDLLQNLERQVELAESSYESIGLKYRIGSLWRDNLQDLARAIDSYREALEIDPTHHETLVALDGLMRAEDGEPVLAAKVLEPIYEASAEFERLIDALEVMVVHAEDPMQKVDFLHRVAELHETRLEAYGDAFAAHARALREDNSNDLTLGHLERLADATGAWDKLTELYTEEADKSLDVPRQVDLLSRLARICEEELGQTDEAIATFKRIVEAEFDNRYAVLSLDRLYSATERWNDLADILRKEIQLADTDEEILTLQFRLGQTLEQALGDQPGAIEVYRDILGSDPSHTSTLGALEMMFLDGQYELEIAAILEPLYEVAGEYEKLHKIYEVQLSKLGETPDRLSMYQRLAELAEGQLYDQGRAFTWWGEALVEDPRSDLAVEEVERLAADLAAWEDTVNVYVRVLETHVQDAEIQRQTLLRLARVYEECLADPARAIETHLRVLELDDKEQDALAALDRLYHASGMYEELVGILRRRIEVTLDGDEITEFYFRSGAIHADALGDLDAALACYEAVLDQDSRNRRALESEEHIYFRREEWKSLYDVYEKLVDVADGDAELADVYARMARLSSDSLDDEETSIDLWGRVLDIRGEDAAALQALQELYGRRGMWDELVEIIERQVAVSDESHEQIRLYKVLGRVWAEKLDRERNSLDAWRCADELNPQDLETMRALAYLYRSTQSWEELSLTLQRIIEVGQVTGGISEDDMIELYAQLGQLEGDILGRVNDAVDAWRRVLALDPSDFRALNALEKLFTREARWEECIEVLEKRALVVDDETSRIDTLLQAAATWEEKVEDLARAAAVYERVRGANPANGIASERLEAIYRAQHQWEHLNEVLLERADNTDDEQDRIPILNAVAKTFEEELGDQESAFVVLQAAFQIDYSHAETGKELERLATAAGRWEELLADYTQVVAGLEAEQPGMACDLWVKIGRWYGDHLSHVDYAIHSVQQALRIDENHLGALGALADFQRKRGSWGELIETLGKHAALETDPTAKVELYLSLADLLETQLQDPIQAISAYQSALQSDGSSEDALVSLDRLYRRHEMWEQLIDVLGRRAALGADNLDLTEQVVRFKLEVGQLWDHRILDSGQAITAYQEVLQVDPQNLAALRELEQLYEKTGDAERYLEVLEAQLDASPSDAEQIALYERMAAAWEERFGKLDRAAECLEKIVALDERNFGAYRELGRLYAQDEKWDSLVDTYRNHIMATTDPATRIDLYCYMGQVYEERLSDHDRAIESYTDVLSFDPDDARALDALGRLYETISEWDRAIDVMSSLVATTDAPQKQVDLYHRIGRITYQRLEDAEQAEEQFLRALTIDPAHVPTMQELVSLYSDRGDWLKAAQMMVRAESQTANVLEKTRLLYDAGRLYLDKLRQPEQATEYLAAVLTLDPEHVDAAEPLSQLYLESEDWPRLSPVLGMLVRKARQDHDRAPGDLNELYFNAARCADELGDNDKAIEFYKAAYDIDSTYLPTLLGRASLLYKMGDWDGAGKIYQTILVQHRDSQDEAQVVNIYYRLGMVRQQLGERRKALNMFEKALEIDSAHRDTLTAVIEIQQATGDWDAVVHAKRGLMATANDDENVVLLSEIGAIYDTKLENAQKAISAYNEALSITPEEHSLLQKLLELYSRAEQWKKAVEIIVSFTDLDTPATRKGSYFQAAGTICRDKLKSHDQAIEYYNNALDQFFGSGRVSKAMLPRALKAFQDIDKILTSKRDWKNQERNYRKMIKRLEAGDPILVDLWHALGEIYRSRLKHYESAIQAFEIAQQLDSSNRNRNEILAELYLVGGPDHADKAVAQHMNMLRDEPFKYDSYKALRSIYMDTHQYDKTWCVCNTLAFLKKADAEEMQFYEQYKPRGFVKAKQRLTEEMWRRLNHPNQNSYIGAILAAIWQGAASTQAMTHKQLGLRRKDRRQIETDQLLFSKIFYYVSQVINVPLPDVFLQDDQPGEILVATCLEKNQLLPTFVVRKDLLSGRPEKEIAFAAARRLCLMRPEHYLQMALPTNTHRKTALLSAIVLVKRDFPVPVDMQANVAAFLPEMQKRIPVQVLEQLGSVVHRFLQNAPEVDMQRWGHAVDATSHRLGFVICGDLETAARMVSSEPCIVGGPQAKDKIKELVLYSVSEDYFAVRSHLQLTIG